MKLYLKGMRAVIAKLVPFYIRPFIPLKIARHLYFVGVFKARLYGQPLVKLINEGHQIENEIYWRGFEGCHEKKSMQMFAETLRIIRPQVVWDIGANSGTYGILAKAIIPDAKVYFFEPIPRAVEMIHKNLQINNFEGEVFQLALGDYDGRGKIYFKKGEDFATSVTVNKNLSPQGQAVDGMEIFVRRADTLLKEFAIGVPALVKLDVETYEYEVLKGFGATHFNDCIFLIEILSDDLAKKLTPFFPSQDYDYYNIDDYNRTVKMTSSLGKSDFYNFLICPKILSPLLNFYKSKNH